MFAEDVLIKQVYWLSIMLWIQNPKVIILLGFLNKICFLQIKPTGYIKIIVFIELVAALILFEAIYMFVTLNIKGLKFYTSH